jgi:Rad3-related DNA helicase
MNSRGQCSKYSGKMQTDCERVGLLMIQPVLRNLEKMKTEIKSLNSKFKTIDDKKKFLQDIFSKIQTSNNPNIKTISEIYKIKSNINDINDSDAKQVFDIFSKLNDDTIDGLYILSNIIGNKYILDSCLRDIIK